VKHLAQWCLLLLTACPAIARDLLIEVAAGAADRVNTPISLALPDSMARARQLTMRELDTARPVDIQVDHGRAVWILRDRLKAGETRRYRLSEGGARTAEAMTAEDDGKRVVIKAGARAVLQYNSAVVPSAIPSKPEYRRSGYLHPVYDPAGRPVTDDMAPDHAHQHGVMFPYEKTTFEGRPANFWEPSNGSVEHEAVRATASGPVFAGFEVVLRHMVNDAPGGPRQALKETWDVRAYNVADVVLFDLESVQAAAGPSPLIVEKNAYGGLAIRCHRNWFDPKNSEYLTSEGKTRKDGNQTRPVWVDLYGDIDGRVSGVAIFDHPGNLHFPQPVRLHPEKPYFCFAPMAVAAFEIGAAPLVSRYRFYIHMDKPDPARIAAAWRDYADPPQVRIVSN
jgi:hypothetical protein